MHIAKDRVNFFFSRRAVDPYFAHPCTS